MFKPPGGAALRRVYPEVIMADTVQNVLFVNSKRNLSWLNVSGTEVIC